MKFTYKAQKLSGEFYEGEGEAADEYALAHALKGSGETLISAAPAGARFSIGFRLLSEVCGRISAHDKILFARNLGGMIGAGLPVSRALAVLERQARAQKLKKIIVSLNERISSGESLSQALSAYPRVFSPLFISMVRAGEEGGNLKSALKEVAEHLDRTYALKRKIRGALIYPCIVLAIMLIVGVLMIIFIVPQLTASFKEFNVDLPRSTKIVIAVSNVMTNHLLLGLSALLGFGIAALAAAKSRRGRRAFDFALLRLPGISPLIKGTNSARTGETLSSLLSAGVDAVKALGITADTLSNSYCKEVLLLARDAIERGEPMSAVFRAREDIYPPALSEMMAVGEETGKLSEMLREIGIFFEEEMEQKTKNLAIFIEPALMVIVGVAVGFFAVAMISPAYSLMNNI